MGKVLVYIASSLDGFIARRDDDISWLDRFSVDSVDYGYTEFMKNIGTAIMGARTYEQSLLHPERLLASVKNYIITRRILPVIPGIDTVFWHDSLSDLVNTIKKESNMNIFIVGGGQIISRFIDEGLVDEVRQFIIPVILHDGILLYSQLTREIYLEPIDTVKYQTDIVELRYSLTTKLKP